MDTLPNTREVRADKLERSDTILKDDGSYDTYVLDVYTDDDGTWLETEDSLGYISPHVMFLIEWTED